MDCFEVRNIEEIFRTTLTEDSVISTDFETVSSHKKQQTTEDNKPAAQHRYDTSEKIVVKNEKRPISKTEAKDFLGPLRCSETTSSS